MNLIEKYKTIRKIGTQLNQKIIESSVNRELLTTSGKLLGIIHKETFIFESEDETNVLMDFAIHEIKVDNKNAIKIYQEKTGWENEIEKEILDALLLSYTSLFKVTSVSEEKSTIFLYDILNKKNNIELMDINFSKFAVPGVLVFFRLIPFNDYNITSGISFAFPGSLEKYILRKYNKLSKKIKIDNDSIKRFVSFFRMNKNDGIEVRFFEAGFGENVDDLDNEPD